MRIFDFQNLPETCFFKQHNTNPRTIQAFSSKSVYGKENNKTCALILTHLGSLQAPFAGNAFRITHVSSKQNKLRKAAL